MSSFYDELASKLDADGVGVFDVATNRNIFAGVLPATPDKAVAILGLPGANLTAARDVADLNFPRFQVVTRDKDFEVAADLLVKVRTSLHGLIGVDLTSWHIMRCHAEQDGSPIGKDGEGRFEFSINFTAEYYAIPEAP